MIRKFYLFIFIIILGSCSVNQKLDEGDLKDYAKEYCDEYDLEFKEWRLTNTTSQIATYTFFVAINPEGVELLFIAKQDFGAGIESNDLLSIVPIGNEPEIVPGYAEIDNHYSYYFGFAKGEYISIVYQDSENLIVKTGEIMLNGVNTKLVIWVLESENQVDLDMKVFDYEQ